jgi:hypothetical protein
MMYEVSKEVFKQRLCEKHNFAIINLAGDDTYEGIEKLSFDGNFSSTFEGKYPNKAQNVLLFSLNEGDDNPRKAAEQLQNAGYHFVYYYHGEKSDLVLDKGIN